AAGGTATAADSSKGGGAPPQASAAAATSGATAPIVIEVAPRPIFYVVARMPVGDMAAGAKVFAAAYAKVGAAMHAIGAEQDGALMAITISFDPKGDWVFEAAVPVKGAPSMPFQDAEVKTGATPTGRVVKAVHVGPYATLRGTYDVITA